MFDMALNTPLSYRVIITIIITIMMYFQKENRAYPYLQ